MKHRLTVKIEKRFKRQLSERFNPRNAKVSKHYTFRKEIKIECSLCKEYLNGYNCFDCPFRKFEDGLQKGCLLWIDEIMREGQLKPFQISDRRIYWYKDSNQETVEFLKKLRKEAKKYIVWI